MGIKTLFTSSLIAFFLFASGQILEPAKWSVAYQSISESEFTITATAVLDAGWHVYATQASANPEAIGPISTDLRFTTNPNCTPKGSVKQGKFITHFDPNFEMDLNYFEGTAAFIQRFTRTGKDAFTLEGEVEYMACDDTRCIFPAPFDFSVRIPATTSASVPVTEDPAVTDDSESAMLNPVKWDLRVEQLKSGQFELIYTSRADPHWHIYSQHLESDQGPVPTTFAFTLPDGVSRVGDVREPKAISMYDPNFMMQVRFHDNVTEFRQEIASSTGQEVFETSVEFMCCNEETCLPPLDLHWRVNLGTRSAVSFNPDADLVSTQFSNDPFRMEKVDLANPVSWCGTEQEQLGLWMIFLFGLIGGLLALLTPCVFPMIPLTVSFFTKGSDGSSGKRRAVLYGFFILLIYFILSLPFHLSKNVDPEVLNNIATNVWLNLAFFIIFIVFAISFFGFFEITLPSGLANKVDKGSSLSGAIGVFFMALTLAIVSFSCTGPILGTVIGSIYTTDTMSLISFAGMELSLPAAKVSAAMIGFGISLGLPFGLFAAFPAMLKKLPKSGGWLEDFKVSLGFAEVALALKFLSQADLVQQWGLLRREIFFAIWIIIFIFWILYLVGRFRFKAGQGGGTFSKFKLVFTVALVVFTIRLIPGVLPHGEWNRFAFLSGFPPPRDYSIYDHEKEFRIYRDLAEAMVVARAENKPIFLDFTGWACVNCRKMEENVWPDKRVKSLLESEFIMVSLYVDEKVELPEDLQFVYTTADGRTKKIRTVGNRWSTLQTETFNNNSQPYYALLAPDSTLLAPPRQYDTNVQSYADWLACGAHTFRSMNRTSSR